MTTPTQDHYATLFNADTYEALPDREKAEVDLLVRQDEIVAVLLAKGMAPLPAFVQAGDLAAGERWLREARAGRTPAEKAVWLTGSYARVDVATTLWGEGLLSDDWFFREWPAIWRGSDPDDTDPRYWDIWQQAFRRNGNEVILDDPTHPLPGKTNRVRVYRGQRAGDPKGCSWSTVMAVAQAFSQHGGQRTQIKGGKVFRVVVPKAMVLAYITGRNEAEVILDPREMGWVK